MFAGGMLLLAGSARYGQALRMAPDLEHLIWGTGTTDTTDSANGTLNGEN
jgi:hypothetical protein